MAEARQKVLIVDDEPAQRRLLGGFVESLGFEVDTESTAEAALDHLQSDLPDMMLLDVRLPGMSGIEALPQVREIAPKLPVLLITAHADLRQAVAAVKTGADDYLSKPLDLDELAVAISDALGQATRKVTPGLSSIPDVPPNIVCESPPMRRLIETAAVVAESDIPVLISGPSGSGKEVVAQLIHAWSSRSDHALVAANCAGFPESLIESELFGHKKGAFTGASEDRLGLFRAADGGTLFLDELGELPLTLQPKFLRALENKSVTPVGSDGSVSVDTRLIAASNRNLEMAVQNGEFREDLYYRINVMELKLPALEERREDIPLLAKMFASEYAGGRVRLSPQTLHCLLVHSWSGNVRELRNAIQRACLLCRGDVIMPEHLPPNLAQLSSTTPKESTDDSRLSQVERATILATLDECGGNRTHAAKKLGISRRSLIYKLQNFKQDETL